MREQTSGAPPPRRQRLPGWLKKQLPCGSRYLSTKKTLEELQLPTVCKEAFCPNQGECWSQGVATILIMGSVCTRNCQFCGVVSGVPAAPPASDEPDRLAQAVRRLNLQHVVITSVTRDDLSDEGVSHYADCLRAVRQLNPCTTLEILSPDFRHQPQHAVEMLSDADSRPDIWAHNVETVPRLTPTIRSGTRYEDSLKLLTTIKSAIPDMTTKSGIMLGLGESEHEVREVLHQLRQIGTDRMTIGQYLAPSARHYEVVEYILPEKFQWWEQYALQLGFKRVECHPFARSSYDSNLVSPSH